MPHFTFLRKAVLLALGCVLGGLLQAQELRGRVLDGAGEGIPFVRIEVDSRSTRGSISDEDGRFSLALRPGTYQLVFHHVGFISDTIQAGVPGNELQVVLADNPFTIQQVEIQAGKKDPAYEIIRQTIENKRENRDGPDAFVCQTYVQATLIQDDSTLFKYKPPKEREIEAVVKEDSLRRVNDSTLADTLRSDSLLQAAMTQLFDSIPPSPTIQTFVEFVAQTYYLAPGMVKTIMEGYRDYHPQSVEGGGITVSFGDANSSQDYRTELNNPFLFLPKFPGAGFTFYQNLIPIQELGDRPFISPLHSTLWQLIYEYKLLSRTYVDGQVVFEIAVTPRNPEGPYFSGTIWIVNGDWAIKQVDLSIQPSGLSLFRNFRFQHQYERRPGAVWLLTDAEYKYAIQGGRTIHQATTKAQYREYNLAAELSPRMFKQEVLRTDAEAFEQDSSFWTRMRPYALEQKVEQFVVKQDSISLYHNSAEYIQKQDSIYNHLAWDDFLFNGIAYLDRGHGMHYFLDPLASQPRPFGVGGYRHSVGGSVVKTWNRQKQLRVRASMDYGFNNRDLKGEGGLYFLYDPRKAGRVFASVGDNYSTITNFTNLGAILSRSNFVNKRFIRFGASRELLNGLFLGFETDMADYRAIDQLKLSEFGNNLFGELNIPLEFDPFRQMILEVNLRYTPFQKFYMEPFRKVYLPSPWPTFAIQYRHSIPGVFGSKIHFSAVTFSIDHEFRPGAMGIARWRVRAGTFPIQQGLRFTDYTFFRGSDPYLFANPLAAFQLLGPTISTPNEYVEGHFLHDFGGALIDKIPLLKRTPLMITVGAGGLYIEDQDFWHSEVFGGLLWPIRIKTLRFKIGAYYVTSYSNHSDAIASQIKFGVSFYDPSRQRWDY